MLHSVRRDKEFYRLSLVRSVIFFFNIFLALMIITGSYFLLQTKFGRFALFFGLSMLALSVLLRILKQW